MYRKPGVHQKLSLWGPSDAFYCLFLIESFSKHLSALNIILLEKGGYLDRPV